MKLIKNKDENILQDYFELFLFISRLKGKKIPKIQRTTHSPIKKRSKRGICLKKSTFTLISPNLHQTTTINGHESNSCTLSANIAHSTEFALYLKCK